MPSTNLFTSAKTVPAKKTKAKVETPTVEIPGLEKYAAICAVEKVVKSLKDTYRKDVNDHMIDQFVIDGTGAKKRPGNFKGSDGSALASCELRKRSSASGLNEAEIELLTQYGVETEESVDTIETFIINPEYVNDSSLLEKVSKALAKVPGLPSDFIMAQEGSKKTVISDSATDQVFTLPEKAVRQLIEVVFTPSIKPTKLPEIETSLEIVSELFRNQDEDDE